MEKIIENAIQRLRKYLQEWENEQNYAAKHGAEPKFSWYWHDKELISIQGGIREAYTQANSEELATLTQEEKNEIDLILSCVID